MSADPSAYREHPLSIVTVRTASLALPFVRMLKSSLRF
jgi:hypothetical protein